MATKQTTHDGKNESEPDAPTRRSDVPGSYFGIDGNGMHHYFQMGSRTMTMVDPDTNERKYMSIPAANAPEDAPLVDYSIHVVEQWEAYWEDIRLEEPKASWLQGDVPVGEVADDE